MKTLTTLAISLLTLSLGWTQIPKWIVSSAPKNGTVFIPKKILNDSPFSTDTLIIGFFILDTPTSFQCVGKDTLNSLKDATVQIGYDISGNVGYQSGERFITLVYNLNNYRSYAIEFNYLNNEKYFTPGTNHTVESVKIASWNNQFPTTFCQSDRSFLIQEPYGTTNNITTSTGLVVSSNTINFENTVPGNYSVRIENTSTQISWTPIANFFEVLEYPISALNEEYILCKDDEIKITSPSADGLTRTPINTGDSNTLVTAGDYYFNATYTNGCTTIDTITVTNNSVLDLSNLFYMSEDAACGNLGKIEIDTTSLDYTFVKSYLLDAIEVNAPKFHDLSNGSYIIGIKDTNNCITNLSEIKINQVEDCDEDIVLDPNNTDNTDYIRVKSGVYMEVFNRSDQKVYSTTGPDNWTGTDSNNNVLPTGIYFIQFEDGTQKTVTIIQ